MGEILRDTMNFIPILWFSANGKIFSVLYVVNVVFTLHTVMAKWTKEILRIGQNTVLFFANSQLFSK